MGGLQERVVDQVRGVGVDFKMGERGGGMYYMHETRLGCRHTWCLVRECGVD
jgi:hypothetical protein